MYACARLGSEGPAPSLQKRGGLIACVYVSVRLSMHKHVCASASAYFRVGGSTCALCVCTSMVDCAVCVCVVCVYMCVRATQLLTFHLDACNIVAHLPPEHSCSPSTCLCVRATQNAHLPPGIMDRVPVLDCPAPELEGPAPAPEGPAE